MELNGKQVSSALVEQITTLADIIRDKKHDAIANMRETVEAMHMQGTLLVQAEIEFGDAFGTFVEQLSERGVDPDLARYNLKLAKKHKTLASLIGSPAQVKQLVLQNFAPASETEPSNTERTAPAFTLAFHLTTDPMDWSNELKAEFMTKARPIVRLVEELGE